MSQPDHATQGLEPCPFCGSKPSEYTREDESLFSHAIVPYLTITCTDCDCASICGEDFYEVRALWNTRPTPTPTSARPSREDIARVIVGPEISALQLGLNLGPTGVKEWMDALAKADEILALLALMPSPWRPISEAPREEGSQADLWAYPLPGSKHASRWPNCQFRSGEWMVYGDVGEEEPEWWALARPTHWMPLPPIPEEGA